MDRNTLLDLIPAYALGALDPDERAEVEAFLATDAEAQKLLAEYQALTDAIVLTTPARRAPAHLNADLRQRLAGTRSQTTQPVTSPAKPAPRRMQRWMPYVVAAAAVLVIAVAAIILRRPLPPDDPAQRYEWIMAQADRRTIPITPANSNSEGELVLTSDGRYGVIEVSQLPTIQTNQTFQLWLVDDGGAHSGGLLQFAQPQGQNFIIVPLEKPVDAYKGFGVSIEPAGGSPKADGPSGPRVFGITVPA